MAILLNTSPLLLQLTSAGAQGWERVGLIGFLVTAIVLLVSAFVLGERVFFGVVPGYRYKGLEDECKALRDENRKLWEEKVEDAKRAADVAEAYVKIRSNDA